MIGSVLLALALTQTPVSQFDDGAVIGRVCDDLDGDGACSAEEPGVAGARVLLETGLEAMTDRDGRFHLAAVPGRVADTWAGGRLVQGRHRLKLDTASLAGEWEGADRGVTFEVPMGGAAYVELPSGRAFILAVFTQGKAMSDSQEVLPAIAEKVSELAA